MADYPRTRTPGPAQSPAPNPAALTKAQQFEEEKRRIIASCFSKTDADGSLLESYITHCKVIEDAEHPSAPPPIESSSSDQKKMRVILVAVRKSGRVRVHKARENGNGSFSIGKTWNLDDLQQIENHTQPNDRGFTVTLVKPYYWQANSAKEKDFFISSILKIFKKYTGGKIPDLVGFERTDVDKLLDGAASMQARQRQLEETFPSQSTSPTPISASSPRNLSGAPSIESMTKAPLRSGASPRLKDPVFAAGSGALHPSPSSDRLANRKSPEKGYPMDRNLSGRSVASNDSFPAIQAAARPTVGERRPSDGSSIRSGQSRYRSNSRPPVPDEDRAIRPAPSNEMFRSPSAMSQQSRDVPESYAPFNRAEPAAPVPQSTEARPVPLKKKSTKDVASQFRLAANTYSAGGAMNSRPKTPTTPSLSGTPELPQIKFPEEMQATSNGNGTARISEDSQGRRARSQTRSQDSQFGSPSEHPPVPMVEPPPRNDRRPPPLNKGGFENVVPVQAPKSPLGPPRLPPSLLVSPDPRGESNLDVPSSANTDRRTPSPERSLLDAGANNDGARSRSRSPNTKARKRKSNKISDNLDTSNMTVDLEDILNEFNWDGRGRVEVLETEIKKELAIVESSNVVVNTAGDERIEELSKLLDKSIRECEEMDGLLTLYAVELTSLNDDISHIENQSQGLQVQTANQKTLQRELQNLLSTISISPQQLDALKQGSLESPQGLERIEVTLLALYKAMTTIDPQIHHGAQESPVSANLRGSWSDEGVGSMRALQEKKEGYRHESRAFLGRMRQFLNIKFQAEIMELGKNSRSAEAIKGSRPILLGHESAYYSFWRFAGLVAFARDVDPDEYLELQRLYERPTKALYQDEFRDHVFAWKRITRKPTQDEIDLVFTVQEKDTDNVAVTAARKLTVKRSQTLAKIRSPTGDGFSKDKNQDGKIHSNEAFAGAISEMYNLVFREQNFVVEFFHLSSQNPTEFIEFVSSSTPESRRLGDLGGRRPTEPDKSKARAVLELMGEVFEFLPQDLQNFVDWAIKSDPVQGVGVLFAIEEKLGMLEDTSQEFLIKLLQKLHDRLAGLFSRFLDDQVRAVEEVKVKIKKRKGVIGFMKVFPGFTAKIELQLPPESLTPEEELDVRDMVNEGYEKINKAMFESLQAIAKESPNVASQSVDPEDKEQLNYHIMMIENMHHYLEEVDTRRNSILEEFKRKAEAEFREHMSLYVGAVIRRPLGKLLDFLESISSLQKSGIPDDSISVRQSHSRHVFKKLLSSYDSKEIRRGIETLKKRVDKHFGDSDDAALCAKLVEKIFVALEAEYIAAHKKVQMVVLTVYKDSGLECEFMVADVQASFRHR